MAYPVFTAGSVMDISAALLNDRPRNLYTYEEQIPYLQIACDELQEHFQVNNIPVTNATSAEILVAAGVTEIGFPDFTPTPNLPENLIEIRQLWYSPTGLAQWIPMTRRDYLPHYISGVEIADLTYYTWNDQKLEFLPATSDNDIKLDYIETIFPPIVDENTQLAVINSKTFLEYRTAALCARFIGENPSRSDELDTFAVLGSDRTTSIGTKGRQAQPIRRRPFRASYKSSWGGR